MTGYLRVICLCFFGILASWAYSPTSVEARDRRFALVVANQDGWKGDPKLRYVVRGDMLPLVRSLRRIGFTVVTLKNRSADALRRILPKVEAQLKLSKVNTFLFYYSGHADQHFLHMGKKGKKPFHYKEIAGFLSRIPVRRRIAILDACYSGEFIRHFGSLAKYREALYMARSKGVRIRKNINLKKVLLPGQGKESGIRILSSSLGLSWESPRFRSSIFTHYLLLGLNGKADIDQDGRVSSDELFDYVSREVKKATGQQPQQLALVKRGEPYALAPAYRSRLWIGAKVKGNIKVSVGNFQWIRKKQDEQAIRLAVVHGKGTVFLQKEKNCWKQSLLFPKNGEARLRKQWMKVSCQKVAQRAKGSISLPALKYAAPPKDPLNSWNLALSGGLSQLGSEDLNALYWNVGLGARHSWLGFGLLAGFAQPANKTFSLTRFQMFTELGWPIHLFLGDWDGRLFVGGYLQGGLGMQQKEGQASNLHLFVGAGATISFTWWLKSFTGFRVRGMVGADYAPTVSTPSDIGFLEPPATDPIGISLEWRVLVSWLWVL